MELEEQFGMIDRNTLDNELMEYRMDMVNYWYKIKLITVYSQKIY